jgi:hypothetical protein
MDLGVERLDPAVHHLGKAGEVGDVAHFQPGVAQRLGGAAGRDQVDTLRGERRPEFDDPGLVGDREKRAPDLDLGPCRPSLYGSGARKGQPLFRPVEQPADIGAARQASPVMTSCEVGTGRPGRRSRRCPRSPARRPCSGTARDAARQAQDRGLARRRWARSRPEAPDGSGSRTGWRPCASACRRGAACPRRARRARRATARSAAMDEAEAADIAVMARLDPAAILGLVARQLDFDDAAPERAVRVDRGGIAVASTSVECAAVVRSPSVSAAGSDARHASSRRN